MESAIYEKFANKYDKILAPLERRFLYNWRKELLATLPTDCSVLEIGAGTGANAPFLGQVRFGVLTEQSRAMLQIAQNRELSRNLFLLSADAHYIPFADNTFDVALGTLIFCSLKKPEEVFCELKRVVKKDGRIFLLEHVRPNGILGSLFDFLNFFTIFLINDCVNRRTAEIAERCGLKIVERREKAFGVINLLILEC